MEGELFRIDADQNAVIRELRHRLSDAEKADVRVANSRSASLLSASTLDDFGRRLDTLWLEEAVANDSFTTYFQPIVDLRSQSTFAHECLIRLFADRAYSGGEIMDAAISRGQVHLFDSYARRLSIRKAAEQFRPGSKIFVNFMPSSIYDPVFCMASTMEEMSKTSLSPADVVFEVVESDEIRDSRHLKKICDYYREGGFGFALDDVGTGTNSLQMVCDLKPNYIKLDKSLISRLPDPMFTAAVRKLTEFAQQFGLEVIAEGVESAEMSEQLQQLGIYLMQGYYFGKPRPQMFADLSSTSSMSGGSGADVMQLPR